MAREAVFYFDVLGFADLPTNDAVRALTDLAAALTRPRGGGASATSEWPARYALSDSVFLAHPDPVWAINEAAELVSNLLLFTRGGERPLLVRGAIALDTVEHLRGVFTPDAGAAANVVGPGVVRAVRLAEASGLKGPRLLVPDELAAHVMEVDPRLARWRLRPTETPGAWEVLWPLPDRPEQMEAEADILRELCTLALELAGRYGGHPRYGDHYREFALLAARCLGRVVEHEASMTLARPSRETLAQALPATAVSRLASRTSGLPRAFVQELAEVAAQLARWSASRAT